MSTPLKTSSLRNIRKDDKGYHFQIEGDPKKVHTLEHDTPPARAFEEFYFAALAQLREQNRRLETEMSKVQMDQIARAAASDALASGSVQIPSPSRSPRKGFFSWLKERISKFMTRSSPSKAAPIINPATESTPAASPGAPAQAQESASAKTVIDDVFNRRNAPESPVQTPPVLPGNEAPKAAFRPDVTPPPDAPASPAAPAAPADAPAFESRPAGEGSPAPASVAQPPAAVEASASAEPTMEEVYADENGIVIAWSTGERVTYPSNHNLAKLLMIAYQQMEAAKLPVQNVTEVQNAWAGKDKSVTTGKQAPIESAPGEQSSQSIDDLPAGSYGAGGEGEGFEPTPEDLAAAAQMDGGAISGDGSASQPEQPTAAAQEATPEKSEPAEREREQHSGPTLESLQKEIDESIALQEWVKVGELLHDFAVLKNPSVPGNEHTGYFRRDFGMTFAAYPLPLDARKNSVHIAAGVHRRALARSDELLKKDPLITKDTLERGVEWMHHVVRAGGYDEYLKRLGEGNLEAPPPDPSAPVEEPAARAEPTAQPEKAKDSEPATQTSAPAPEPAAERVSDPTAPVEPAPQPAPSPKQDAMLRVVVVKPDGGPTSVGYRDPVSGGFRAIEHLDDIQIAAIERAANAPEEDKRVTHITAVPPAREGEKETYLVHVNGADAGVDLAQFLLDKEEKSIEGHNDPALPAPAATVTPGTKPFVSVRGQAKVKDTVGD